MNALELTHFQSGEDLFIEGERTFFFYMIKEGKVEVYRQAEDGSDVVLATIEDGQSLGEFAMIDKQPRSASARAITSVVAVKISEEAYAALLEELPSWAQSMMEGLVTRLRKANEIIRKSEGFDEETITDFTKTQFEPNSETEINFEADFANLTVKKTG